MKKADTFIGYISSAVKENKLLKISFGNKRDKSAELKNVFIKPVKIKEKHMLSFVYRYPTKDITKNFEISEALKIIRALPEENFYNADLYTASHTYYYTVDSNSKEKLVTKFSDAKPAEPALLHDKQKKRILNSDALYLKELGITTAEGNVKKGMQHKYRQINRYVEIIAGILKDEDFKKGFSVADMGSGKGYLTFALYDYLQIKNIAAKVTGIELREDLVTKCNHIAALSKYTGLLFKKGSIQDTVLEKVDMLIALHACDTATDDAIYKGIKADAKIIICAPCCHKQIRKQMAPVNALQHLTKHGILLERQAEMVTDAIRALMLEAHGYKTKVFDFIEQEDTPKNVLIVGIKETFSSERIQENMHQIQELKELFGIKEHYLEKLFS